MANSWKEETEKEMNIVEWVSELRKKLEVVGVVVQEREKKSKEDMKKVYNMMAQHKDLEIGALVLTKLPRQPGKMDDKWEGPFGELEKYEVMVNGRKRRRIV